MIKLKLFVTDYDNTLYINEETMEENINKLKELKQSNYYIVISTGRSIPSIKEKIEQYNIPFDYLTCADGSIIYNKNYELIKFYEIKKDIINEIINFKNNTPYEEMQISYQDGYSNTLNLTKKISGINIVIHNKNITTKINDLFNNLKEKYPNYNYLIYNHEPYSYFCIKQKDVSKAQGIRYLSQYLNIEKQNIYVIGDSDNDLEMLKEFNGVCVYNSTPNILKLCNEKYSSVKDYINNLLTKTKN